MINNKKDRLKLTATNTQCLQLQFRYVVLFLLAKMNEYLIFFFFNGSSGD